MTTIEVLKTVKERIETKGWLQNRAYFTKDPEGPRCLGSAFDDIGDKTQDACINYNLACKLLEPFTGTSIILWNDAPGRTKEEVLELLDKAIAKFETENKNEQ